MKKVRWITGKLYNVKDFAEIIHHDQWRNPFCERIDNQQYMKSTKDYGRKKRSYYYTCQCAYTKAKEQVVES